MSLRLSPSSLAAFSILALAACGGGGGEDTTEAKQALMTAYMGDGQLREGCTCLIAKLDEANYSAAQFEAAQGGFLSDYQPGPAIKADPVAEGKYHAAMEACDTNS